MAQVLGPLPPRPETQMGSPGSRLQPESSATLDVAVIRGPDEWREGLCHSSPSNHCRGPLTLEFRGPEGHVLLGESHPQLSDNYTHGTATVAAGPLVSKAVLGVRQRWHTRHSGSTALRQQTRTLVSWRLLEARAICLASFRASIRMMANSNSSCPVGGGEETAGRCVTMRANGSRTRTECVTDRCGDSYERRWVSALTSFTVTASADQKVICV